MLSFLNTALDFITNHMMASSTMIGGIVEMGLRMFPSQKPLSLAYTVSDAIKGLGSVCSEFGKFLDAVLPQKLK